MNFYKMKIIKKGQSFKKIITAKAFIFTAFK